MESPASSGGVSRSVHSVTKITDSAIAEDSGSFSGSSGCTGATTGRYGDVGDNALVGSRRSGLVADIASSGELFRASSWVANQVYGNA